MSIVTVFPYVSKLIPIFLYLSYIWTDAVQYLENYGYLNFTEIVFKYVMKERGYCMEKSSVAGLKENLRLCGTRSVCDSISKYHYETV